MSSSLLKEEDLTELRTIFEAFDRDHDGLLDVDEVGTILQAFGKVMTEAEVCALHWAPSSTAFWADLLLCGQVLDMVTELKPDLKKLPFEDFVNVVCRPMVSPAALAEEVREVYSLFAGSGAAVTATSLREAMETLDIPVSKLLVRARRAPSESAGAAPAHRLAAQTRKISRRACARTERGDGARGRPGS